MASGASPGILDEGSNDEGQGLPKTVTTTLITGANRGLGFETARQLAAAGHQVWIGARDNSRGQEAADAVGARFVQLDVSDDASVAAAVETVGELDVLVNNAGISWRAHRSERGDGGRHAQGL
jgi:NAD(P)-dependent dehydrogenase (short-subunit alcohol dehydrogenase family)